MRKILTAWVVILGVLVSSVFADQLTAAKKADIEKLMRIIGPPDVTQQTSHFVVRQYSQTIRASRPDLPARTYQILAEEINKVIDEHMTAKGGFMDMVVPIYAKHFSHKEIKGLLKFFRTDLGQKYIKAVPLIFQESMPLAQDWWKSLTPLIKERVNTRFKEEGIELKI